MIQAINLKSFAVHNRKTSDFLVLLRFIIAKLFIRGTIGTERTNGKVAPAVCDIAVLIAVPVR